MGIRPERPKPSEGIRFETGVKAGIMNMIDGEEEEAGKESASLGLGALSVKQPAGVFRLKQLNDQNGLSPRKSHVLKVNFRIDDSL